MLTMIPNKQQDAEINKAKLECENGKLKMIYKQEHINAINELKTNLENKKILTMIPRNKHNDELNKLKSELQNEIIRTMISKKEHDDTINRMISKEQHISAVNGIKSDLDTEKQIKLSLITERDD
uniref:Uncharacterized protein n=1 Tax=Strongyloides venezuelensis TaxID=75913 RepID=A0A0K0FT53_STRVS